MTLVVPNVGELLALQSFLNRTLYLGLFANNYIPEEASTFGSLTEVTGGGYARKTLNYAGWTITAGAPTTAVYASQNFTFTGITGGAGTVYGYFVVDDDDILCWAERFSESVLPFSPGNGSLIRVTPRIASS